MKTTCNIDRKKAIVFLTAATILVLTSAGNLQACMSEEMAAIERLDQMSLNLENDIKYQAPAMSDSEAYVYNNTEVYNVDTEAAAERLEDFSVVTEEMIKYRAPEVAEDVEDFEVQAAWDRLENMNLAIEQSIKF